METRKVIEKMLFTYIMVFCDILIIQLGWNFIIPKLFSGIYFKEIELAHAAMLLVMCRILFGDGLTGLFKMDKYW